MKIAVAVDSMKGSLTSLEAGEAVKEGILKADPSAEVKVFPLADGGEGTQEALTKGLGGKEVRCRVKGPMGRPVDAVYGMAEEKKLAVLEMASAAGITLVSPEERDPLHAATYGVGELIRDAVKRGCRQFIIGIGGSATTDGGLGMLQALGYEFLDEEGNPVPADPSGMDRIAAIRSDHVLPELKECSFRCDQFSLRAQWSSAGLWRPERHPGAGNGAVGQPHSAVRVGLRSLYRAEQPGTSGRGSGRRPGICAAEFSSGRIEAGGGTGAGDSASGRRAAGL